ncbi:MAG TPA: hypothetical protein VFR68_10865 [Candidatus Dormibacteraeota bacterium]|nr:hypothetical protein [Candidatus Dormibacteraeota bacterium]
MSKRDDFESRLRSYLAHGARQSPSPDLEERIRMRAFGRRLGWPAQLLAAAAVLVLALGLGFAARQVRLLGLNGSPTPSPAVSPSALVKPSAEPTATPDPRRSHYPLLPPASMHMVNHSTGWAAGSATNRILRTTDGGTHWNDVTPQDATAGTWITFFLDANNAWLASSLQSASGSPDTAVEIYRTADAGRTWQRVGVVPADRGGPSSLDFVDASHGWLTMQLGVAMGSEGIALYGTQDGGATWSKLSEADTSGAPGHLPLSCQKAAPVFLTSSIGWVPGTCSAGGGPFLYVTHDGGRSWNDASLSVPVGFAPSCMCGINSLRFSDSQNGVFVLDSYGADGVQHDYLYATFDGGASWMPRAPLPANCFTVDFLSAAAGWTLDAKHNTIQYTGDGGQHWSALGTVPSSQVVVDFQFVNSAIGWAMGSETMGDTLIKTVDGGRTWTAQLAP